MTLSRSKFQIATKLKFACCVVSQEGVQPDPDRVTSLANFPVPQDQTGVRSSLASATSYFFSFPITSIIRCLYELIGKERTFLWLPEHQFDRIKTILTSDLIVRHFDSLKEVIFLTDTSGLFGLGHVLGHIELDGSGKKSFKIVHCGSKGLIPTQQRHSTIDLECLAIAWAVQKCSFYLRGLPKFHIFTDHRPLEGIFQKDLLILPALQDIIPCPRPLLLTWDGQ